jgi:hypothetical protein
MINAGRSIPMQSPQPVPVRMEKEQCEKGDRPIPNSDWRIKLVLEDQGWVLNKTIRQQSVACFHKDD